MAVLNARPCWAIVVIVAVARSAKARGDVVCRQHLNKLLIARRGGSWASSAFCHDNKQQTMDARSAEVTAIDLFSCF